MAPTLKSVAMLVTLVSSSLAFPGHPAVMEKRYDGFSSNLTKRLGTYQAPGPNDSRGPCPALNTIANHGLINRHGRNLNSTHVVNALARGFGVASDGVRTAIHNFEVVCEYIKGSTCESPAGDGSFILTNLTILGEPHAFEHDHSFSRQDYHQNYAQGAITDNIYFNASEFQNSLDVVNYTPSNPPVKALADYQDFNQIRLQRESQQYAADLPGWFKQNIPTQEFEAGFIFGAMFDRDSHGNMIGDTPLVRLDWWNFWFSEESFPTHLGWVPASTEVFNSKFITSVSKSILAAPVTSTPSSLPPSALVTTAPPAASLSSVDPSPTFALFQGTAYIAPTAPSDIQSEAAPTKRDAAAAPAITLPSNILSQIASEVTAAPSIISSALSLAGPPPAQYNPYQQSLDVNSLRNQIALAQSYEEAVLAKVTSLLGI